MRPLLVSVLAGGVLLILLLPSLAHRSRQPTGKAPIERLIEGLRAPTGIAVTPDGTVFITDEEEGSVFERDPNGTLLLLQDRLKQPRGLVRAEEATLYLVAERMREGADRSRPRGLLLQRSPNGALTIVASGFQHPQHLSWAPDGSLALSTTEGLQPSGSRTKDGDDSDDDEDTKKQQAKKPEPFPGVVFRVNPAEANPAARIVRSYPGFRRPAGVWQDETGSLLVVAAEGFRSGGLHLRGSLFRIDPTGQVTTFLSERFQGPTGLIQDALGAFYLAVEEAQEEDDKDDEEDQEPPDGGLILKVAPGGTFTYFAAGLERPWGLALDNKGHLYVSDPEEGRIYRFRAPDPPILDPHPAATNRPAVSLSGRVETTAGAREPQARITVRGGDGEVSTLANPNGTFAIDVPLKPGQADMLNTLQIYATGHKGEGLTGAPRALTFLRDSTRPEVGFHFPKANQQLSGIVPVEITARDTGSGIANVEFLVDGVLQGTLTEPPFIFTLHTAPFVPPDRQTLTARLTARALDQAGNEARLDLSVELTRLRVTITEPADGATIATNSLRVRGTVEGRDVEVGVNGVPALVSGNQWSAEIPLVLGDNIIIVTATDRLAGSDTARVTVRVSQVPEAVITLKASVDAGLADLIVRFSVESALERPIVEYAFDRNGDGIDILTSATFENVEVIYKVPGLITPTLTVTDDQGRTVTARTHVQVLDKAKTIALFQRKWDAFKAALLARDIRRATAEFAFGVRPRFQEVFQALDVQLPTIAPTLGPVAITRVTDGLAEGVTQRVQEGKTFLYFIYWAPDVDGIWRIIEM